MSPAISTRASVLGTLLVNTADRKYGHWRGGAFKQHHRHVNTANGAFALFSNTTGDGNTAVGDSALLSNTTGITTRPSVASRSYSNINGNDNTAIGAGAHLSTRRRQHGRRL